MRKQFFKKLFQRSVNLLMGKIRIPHFSFSSFSLRHQGNLMTPRRQKKYVWLLAYDIDKQHLTSKTQTIPCICLHFHLDDEREGLPE